MSGVQGGLGEQKRDILKLREEAKGLGLGHPRTQHLGTWGLAWGVDNFRG